MAPRPRTGRFRSLRRRRLSGDRGSSAIELAILAPVLLILSMMIIQFALWFQAREAALAAAEEGAREARELAGAQAANWRGQVVSDTNHYWDSLGTGIMSDVQAHPLQQGQGTGDPIAGVTVTGILQGSLLSMFGNQTISVTVEGPEECFHPLDGGGEC